MSMVMWLPYRTSCQLLTIFVGSWQWRLQMVITWSNCEPIARYLNNEYMTIGTLWQLQLWGMVVSPLVHYHYNFGWSLNEWTFYKNYLIAMYFTWSAFKPGVPNPLMWPTTGTCLIWNQAMRAAGWCTHTRSSTCESWATRIGPPLTQLELCAHTHTCQPTAHAAQFPSFPAGPPSCNGWGVLLSTNNLVWNAVAWLLVAKTYHRHITVVL